MSDAIIGSVGVAVVPDARDFWRKFKEQTDPGREGASPTVAVKVDTTSATAEINKLRAQLVLLDRKVKVDVDTGTSSAKVKQVTSDLQQLADQAQKTADQAQASFNPMIAAIAGLGPGLVPLAAGLGGITSGVVGLGAAGALAFRGISDNIARNTDLGGKYQSVLAGMKSELTSLQDVAAGGVLTGFEQSGAKIAAQMPQLNSMVGQLASIFGDVLSHGVGTVVTLFTTFEPLIVKGAGYVDQFFGGLEHWAQSSTATKFMNALSTDMDLTVKLIEQLLPLVGSILAAFNGPGQVILVTLTGIATALNAIPLPVLTAVAIGITAWGIAGLVAPGIAAASAAVLKLAAANAAAGSAAVAASAGENLLAASIARASAAGAANAGLAGLNLGAVGASESLGAGAASAGVLSRGLTGVGTGLSFIAARAIPIVGIAIGLDMAANATKKWQDSTNSLTQYMGLTLNTAKQLVTFDWSNIGSSINKHLSTSDDAKNIANTVASFLPAVTTTTPTYAGGAGRYGKPVRTGSVSSTSGGGQANDLPFNLALVTQQSQAYAIAMSKVNNANDAAALSNLKASGSLSNVGQAYSAYDKNLTDNIAKEKTWTDVTGNKIKDINGITYSQKAWDAALGQSNGDYVKAMGILEGHSAALRDDQAALAESARQQANLNKFLADGQGLYNLTATQVNVLSGALGINLDLVAKSNTYEQAASDLMGTYANKILNGNIAMQGWLAAIAQVNPSVDTLSQRVMILGAGLTALRGDTLTLADSNLTAVDDFEKLTGTIEVNSASVGAHGELLGQMVQVNGKWLVQQPQLTAGSLAISKEMTSGADAAIKMAQGIYQSSGSADKAFSAYSALKQQFIDTETPMLGNAAAAKGLADQMFGNSANAQSFADKMNGPLATAMSTLTQAILGLTKSPFVTTLNLAGNAGSALGAITSQVTWLMGAGASVNLNLATGAGASSIGSIVKRAAGGTITGPGTSKSDSVLMWGSAGEEVIQEPQASKHRALLKAINAGIDGFAGGGTVLPSFDVNTKAAKDTTPKASSGGGTGAATKATALANLLITIDTVDFSKFLASIPTTAAAIQSAESTLASAVTRAGGGSLLAHALSAENTTLHEMAIDRTEVAGQLKTANTTLTAAIVQWQTEQAAVKKTITSSFDITTAGFSPQQILSTLNQTNQQAALFAQQINTVRSLGLDKNLIAQIAQKGLSAEPELLALSRASGSQIGQINSGVGKLSALGQTIGNQEANSLYGAGVAAAQGLVNGLKSQDKALVGAMTHLADVMVNQIKKDLKIASPSLVMRAIGGHIGEGMALGMSDMHPRVNLAARGLANAAIPALGASSSGGGGDTWHIYEQNDPVATANTVSRYQAMRVA